MATGSSRRAGVGFGTRRGLGAGGGGELDGGTTLGVVLGVGVGGSSFSSVFVSCSFNALNTSSMKEGPRSREL